MPTQTRDRPNDAGAERKPPEEPGSPRSAAEGGTAAEGDAPPVAQIGEDPGTVDPEDG